MNRQDSIFVPVQESVPPFFSEFSVNTNVLIVGVIGTIGAGVDV